MVGECKVFFVAYCLFRYFFSGNGSATSVNMRPITTTPVVTTSGNEKVIELYITANK